MLCCTMRRAPALILFELLLFVLCVLLTAHAAAVPPAQRVIRLRGGRREDGWKEPEEKGGWRWPRFGGGDREGAQPSAPSRKKSRSPSPSYYREKRQEEQRQREKREEESGFTTAWGRNVGNKPHDHFSDKGDGIKDFDEGGFLGRIRSTFRNVQTPGIKWYLKPEKTKLKLRKRFMPLGLTRLTLGADWDPMAGEWSLKTSWKDTVIGGHVNIHGSEIALTKDFPMDDRNALWLKAAYDWQTGKSLIGFTLKPLMGLSARLGMDRPGWSFRKRVPLNENLQLEFDSIIEMPEATYTTSSSQGVCLGIGDFKVDLRQLNLIVEF